LLLALFWGFAGRVYAQPQGTAQSGDEALLQACEASLACKSHLRRANELYKQNSYGAAVEEYQAAYVLQPYPLLLYNIARIHHKQSQLSEAVVYYQRYLDTGHVSLAERAKQLLFEASQELTLQKVQAPQPLAPSRPEPSASLAIPKAPIASLPKKPIYKQAWLWTVVSVAAAGAVVAIGLGIYASGPNVSGFPAKNISLQN
jgi:tetratricopeptide (TPR) repeat protein